jgi:hypothetical protein
VSCSSSEYGTHRCVRCDSEVEDADDLRARIAELEAQLRTVSERQREACAREVWVKSQCATASELGEISSHVRATPLVGGGE